MCLCFCELLVVLQVGRYYRLDSLGSRKEIEKRHLEIPDPETPLLPSLNKALTLVGEMT